MALAQAARHPFAVGGNEGPGAATGLAGLIVAWQNKFHLELQGAARALKTDASALWALAAASFAYGVFHAAGPGHGKAVLASYMIANETALRRGLALAGLAALLQGSVAIAMVGVAAILFNATARQMSGAASLIEMVSYGAIAALGARLVWTKGRVLLREWRRKAAPRETGGVYCEAVEDALRVHGPSCAHCHAPDPAMFAVGFSWPDALATVVAAGARPCSGAILILVFTLSQGAFVAGAFSTLLMAAGTAITTGALASLAVFGKNAAVKLAASNSRGAELIARGAEFLAAVLVLCIGLVLLAGASLAPTGT
ncbi:MAG: high frequency lysogenization protein HflD [Methylocystis sp.]|nr:high frequency lysogenization protein HflD [Methylocystis sp.]